MTFFVRFACLFVCFPLMVIASVPHASMKPPKVQEPKVAAVKPGEDPEHFSKKVNQHREKISLTTQGHPSDIKPEKEGLYEVNAHSKKPSDHLEVKPLSGGFYQKKVRQKTEQWRRQAQLEAKARNYDDAEKFYFKVLNHGEISEDERRGIFLEMVDLYKKQHNEIKMIAIYESYLELYPQDPAVPMIHVAAGDLYRELGSFHLAKEHYYRVINLAMNIDNSKIDEYRKNSVIAKIRIAETFLMVGDYDGAANKFGDLKKLDYLPPEEHASAMFQVGFLQQKMGRDPKAIALLTEFIETYPRDSRVPEAHFLIAESYRSMDQSEKAVQEIFTLLSKSHKRARIDEGVWVFWKKRAGNQIANSLYKDGDFHNALRLYQGITKLDSTPDWQWEVIYQIGLCFERLSLYDKAKEAYGWIVKGEADGEPVPKEEITQRSKELQEMAQWRLEQMTVIDSQMGIIASVLSS